MTTPRVVPFVMATGRVFSLAMSRKLTPSRISWLIAMGLLPVLVAIAMRGYGPQGGPVDAPAGIPMAYGTLVWAAYVRFVIPVIGMWLGTGIIGDDVDGRSLVYLAIRPVARGAVLVGGYLAYLVVAGATVLPSILLCSFALIPVAAMPETFPLVLVDLAVALVGLAAYGAVFAAVGAAFRRPLVLGLLFVIGWEPLVLLLPGSIKRASLAMYLQSMVPHPAPTAESALLPQLVVREVLGPTEAMTSLALLSLLALWAGAKALSRRDL